MCLEPDTERCGNKFLYQEEYQKGEASGGKPKARSRDQKRRNGKYKLRERKNTTRRVREIVSLVNSKKSARNDLSEENQKGPGYRGNEGTGQEPGEEGLIDIGKE